MIELHIVHLLLSTSAADNMDTSQVDIKTAFLDAKLHEEIWLALLAALHKDTTARKITVDFKGLAVDLLQLCRSQYGLKQASLNWYKEVHTMMVKRKAMRPSTLSLEIFYGSNVAVLIRVDDLLIAGNTEMIKAKISTRFNTKDLGTPTH